MTALRTAVLLAGTLLAVAGCEGGNGTNVGSGNTVSSGSAGSRGTSSSVSCVNGRCEIEISGDPTGTRLGVLNHGLLIESIDEGAVTVAVDGESVRIADGATAEVGGLSIRLVSASGGTARLEARRA